MDRQKKVFLRVLFGFLGFYSIFSLIVQGGNDDNTVCALIADRSIQDCLHKDMCQNTQDACFKIGKTACFECCFDLYQHRIEETKKLTKADILLLKNVAIQCGQTCFTYKRSLESHKTSFRVE